MRAKLIILLINSYKAKSKLSSTPKVRLSFSIKVVLRLISTLKSLYFKF